MDGTEKVRYNTLIEQFRYLLEEANFNLAKEKTKYVLMCTECERLQGELQKTVDEVARTQDELQRYKSKFGDIDKVEQ